MANSNISKGYNAAKAGCGIVIANDFDKVKIHSSLSLLQVFCIKDNMPMALVFIIEQFESEQSNVLIKNLEILEETLGQYNIPLILMIGDYESKKTAFIHHTNPKYITETDNINTELLKSTVLVEHNTNWPGTVIKVKNLKNINKC